MDHKKITLFFDFKNLCRIILQNILTEANCNKGFILFHNQRSNAYNIVEYFGLSSKLFQSFDIKKYIRDYNAGQSIIDDKNNGLFVYLKNTLCDKLKKIVILPVDLQSTRRFGFLILLITEQLTDTNQIFEISDNHLQILKNNITGELLEKLDDFNIFDPTTLLFNQDFLYENLYRQIVESERLNSKFSIALLEIKDLNIIAKDNPAQSAQLLKMLSDFLKKNLRKIDVLAMLYNTIISIIFPDLDSDKTKAKLEELKIKLINANLNEKSVIKLPEIEFSYGIADYPQSGKTCETLIRSAIKSMAG